MSGAISEEAVHSRPDDYTLSLLPKSDLGNARRMIARFGDALRYVPRQGWRAWNGRYWDCDDEGEAGARIAAHATADMIRDEVDAIIKKGAHEGEKPEDFDKRIAVHRKWGADSGNAGRSRAMLEQASSLMRRERDLWDEDPLLINCQNVTIKFKENSGVHEAVAFPHNKDDYCTRITRVDYNADAKAPLFTEMLARSMPNDQKRLFLQRYFGYSITGMVEEQKLLFMQGKGADGKSTTINAVAHALGGYSMSASIKSFLQNDFRSGGDASPDIARLAGPARFVPVSEPKKGDRLDDAAIKTMTGGDKMTARKLRQDLIEFFPVFKMCVPCNVLPVITSSDYGTWRRMLLLEWTESMPESEQDIHLGRKLRDEGEGVLAWLVQGTCDYLHERLSVPDSVKVAVEGWRGSADPAGMWLSERFETGLSMGPLTMSEMYRDYCGWCEANSLKPQSSIWLGRMLDSNQIHKDRTGGITTRKDIQFKAHIVPYGMKGADEPPEQEEGDAPPVPPVAAYEDDKS